MKKVLSTICALLLCTYASAYDFEVDGIYYNILSEEDKTCEVTYKNETFNSYSGIVIIPSTANGYNVTSIGNCCFACCSALTSITIPNSVTSIDHGGFECCSALTSITIPNSVTSIGEDVFEYCSALTSITIPNSVTSISDCVFSGCIALTSITIPNSVTSISSGAFYGCSALTSINIPNSVTSISSRAFAHCSALTRITIPNSVTSIGEDAFSGCSNLRRVFSNSSLTLTYGSSNTMFPNAPCIYTNCTPETSGYFLLSVHDNGKKYVCDYYGEETEITLPSVDGVEDYTFYDRSDLKSISIPNSITSVGNFAFKGCNGMTSISISHCVTSIGYWAFAHCYKLTSINIPNSVKSIGDYAFMYCTSLTSIIIPNSVISIGDYSFNNCYGLKSITIPNSVTSIGSNAFYNCNNINETNISCKDDDDFADYVSRTDIKSIFHIDGLSCGKYNIIISGEKKTNISIPNSVTSIGKEAFNGFREITSISIPNSVTSIGDGAFHGCVRLSSINIPNSITTIELHALSECTSLSSITIPNSVKSIKSYAFKGCTSLESITIPNSVTDIESFAFERCSNITNIDIPNSITTIKSNTFYKCSGLTSINIPNSVTSVEYEAFRDCSALTSITIPNSVTIIGYCAFYGCRGITSITIPNSVTNIANEAFGGCTNLTSITNLATIPQSISSGVFPSDGITIHVLPGCKEAYQLKSVWRDYVIKEDAVLPTEEVDANTFSVTDGSIYESNSITHATTLNYSRTFNNTNWQALYIPFSMSYDDFSDKLEIAWLNNVHMYDDNNDGDPDRTMLEFYIMSNGETKPNTPYLVRSKETGTFNITKSNADVYPAECEPFECSTFYQTFTVRGTYSGVSGADMYSNHYYAPVNGKLSFASSSNASLKPQRWYLKVTNKDGSNVTNLAPSIRMSIDGEVIEESEDTGICSTIDQSRSNKLYTLDGRRIIKPSSQGLFVQNNKIVIVK